MCNERLSYGWMQSSVVKYVNLCHKYIIVVKNAMQNCQMNL